MIPSDGSEEATMRIVRCFFLIAFVFGLGALAAASQNEAGRHRRSVGPQKRQPTSFELIEKAEKSGALDSETALLYRVFAMHGDTRLPAAYRGDDSKVFESLYMGQVRERYATLSPATQAALRPFLIPPAYEGSWANGSPGVSASDTPPPCKDPGSRWTYFDAGSAPVRVWYRLDLVPNDASRAAGLTSYIDGVVWPKLTALMSRPPAQYGLPLSDAGQPCNGGDGRLDLYLVDSPITADNLGLTKSYFSCKANPVWIEIDRSTDNGTVTHEIFHAFQHSYPLPVCLTDADYDWWTEASATWAEDYVDPGLQSEQPYASDFLDETEQPLDSDGENHEYGAYLLPFFVARSSGSSDFVRVAWENCIRDRAVKALDDAMPQRFATLWKDFATYNWNREPVADYQKWDDLSEEALPATPTLAGNDGTVRFTLNYDLPPLSATYYDLTFEDPVASVIFWNGVTYKLDLRVPIASPDGVRYVTDEADPEKTKGANVTAIIRKGDTWQEPEDWTGKAFAAYCRDDASESIDELVLIISNSEYQIPERTLDPPGLTPVVMTSDIGCARWDGTTSLTARNFTVTATVTWTRKPPSDVLPPFAITYKPAGTVNWSFSDVCTKSGSTPIDSDAGFLITYNFAPLENPYRRAYVGTGSSVPTSSCNTTAAIPFWGPPVPPMFGDPSGPVFHVRTGGKLMDDSVSTTYPGPVTISQSWQFTAKPR